MSEVEVSVGSGNYQQSAPRRYRLTFKENRSFELTVGRTTIFFSPNGNQIVDEFIVAKMTPHEKSFFNVEAI